tara:strand:+ start:68 stop:598 length:531 start_codon:yes stop_codon:yes gene_type:complete
VLRLRRVIEGRRTDSLRRVSQASVEALCRHIGGDQVIPVSATEARITTSADMDTIAAHQKTEIRVDGVVLSGRLLPVMDEGSIFLYDRDGTTHRLYPKRIDWLTVIRSIVGQIAATTVSKGLEGTLKGAKVGLFAGLMLQDFSALDQMAYWAAVGGIVWVGLGLLDGVTSAEGSRT